MSNTIEENALVLDAFKQIQKKYASVIHYGEGVARFVGLLMSGKGENISAVVKFQEEDAFNNNLKLFNIRANTGCQTTAFTARGLLGVYTNTLKGLDVPTKSDREIYINRQRANRTVVVHELLHFLTHPAFYNRVRPPIQEAVTEFFTRKILRNSAAVSAYGTHHDYLMKAKQQFKSEISPEQGGPGKGYLRRAYFAGDAEALRVVLQHRTFSELLDMLNLLDS